MSSGRTLQADRRTVMKSVKWGGQKILLVLLVIFLLCGGCGENTTGEITHQQPSEWGGEESVKPGNSLPVPVEPTVEPTPESSEELLMLAGIPLESAFLCNEDGSIIGLPCRDADLNSLFDANDFEMEEPSFISAEDPNIPPLTLYYNESTEMGIGILGEAPYSAFGFVGISDASGWDVLQWKNASKALPKEEPEEIKDYYVQSEYDEGGRLIRFRSYGDLSDIGQPEKAWITVAEYTYDGRGVLRARYWARNSWINETGTTNSSIWSYFDELGRVIYERHYITHGSMEFYYFYDGGSMTPSYGLFLDLYWPEVWFTRYETE